MNTRTLGAATLCLTACLVLRAYGAQATGEQDTRAWMLRMVETLHRRDVAVEQSMAVLHQADVEKKCTFNDPRLMAIRVLGQFADKQAVHELLRWTRLTPPSVSVDETHRFVIGDRYPAVGALIKIGKASVPACLWKLRSMTDEREREKLCWVIRAIEGQAVGQFVFGLEIEKEAVPEKKARLRSALEEFKKLFPVEAGK